MRYGIVNHSLLDTSPGAGGPFSPPAGFEDQAQKYRAFMVGIMSTDPGVRQHVALVARRMNRSEPPRFIGPYAGDAEKLAQGVLRKLAQHLREPSQD